MAKITSEMLSQLEQLRITPHPNHQNGLSQSAENLCTRTVGFWSPNSEKLPFNKIKSTPSLTITSPQNIGRKNSNGVLYHSLDERPDFNKHVDFGNTNPEDSSTTQTSNTDSATSAENKDCKKEGSPPPAMTAAMPAAPLVSSSTVIAIPATPSTPIGTSATTGISESLPSTFAPPYTENFHRVNFFGFEEDDDTAVQPAAAAASSATRSLGNS